jgi:hypothetical protein
MNLLECLRVFHFNKKIRLGCNNNGGYVIADLDGSYNCYISAGIFNEESFSRDFLNKYKLNKFDCFAFDCTIDKYPYQYTKNILFIKNNINDFNDDFNTDLKYLINKYDNIFLKMDIEGWEYKWLLTINNDELKKFKQIVIKFHGITNDEWNSSHNDKVKCFEKLNKTHYIIHAHANNYGKVCNNIPDIIELTYVNKNYFDFTPSYNIDYLPIPHLDAKNCYIKNEISLNIYPFKENSTFPKIIHLVHKNYGLLEKSHKQWKTLNPEYTIELYDDDRCRKTLFENFGQLYYDVFNFIKDGAIKCDFFRVCVLYLYGGIYVDSDIKPFIPISEFIEDDLDFATCISYNYTYYLKYNKFLYNPQFILAKKFDENLYNIINKYINNYINKIDYSYWAWSICQLMNKINDFDLHVNSDNIFIYNNKKYKFLIENIINNTDNIIYNFSNYNSEEYMNRYSGLIDYAYVTYKNSVIFENFTNK